MMIVELHMLQNFAPSCLNRDDTNSPKDCEFGGYRRARISSQCIKRAVRKYFRDAELLPEDKLACRTKLLVEHEVVPALVARGQPEDAARRAAIQALAAAGLKVDEKKSNKTQYLLYLGRSEIDRLTQVVVDHFDDLAAVKAAPLDEGKKPRNQKAKANAKAAVSKAVRDTVSALLDGGNAVDLALFGRMLADQPSFNVDAACQVAHAISTNRVAMEMDYFTAVDDLQSKESEEGAGAGMIGTIEFNSSCFYRYADIDLCQLHDNFQENEALPEEQKETLAKSTVTAFIRAAVEAIPTGKQNTFAAHNPPDLIMAVVRSYGQWNLANAFVQPVRGDDRRDLVGAAADRLGTYWNKLTEMFGANGTEAVYVWRDGEDLTGLNGSRVRSVPDLLNSVQSKLTFADCARNHR